MGGYNSGLRPKGEKPIHSRSVRTGGIGNSKGKGSRSVAYNNQLGTRIASLLSDGGSITRIAQLKDMPHRTAILRWYRDNADFRKLMDIAVIERADYYLDKIIEVFDRVEKDQITLEKAKFLVDQWKWILLKMHPKFEENRKPQEENTKVQFQITLDTKRMLNKDEVQVIDINPLQIEDKNGQEQEESNPIDADGVSHGETGYDEQVWTEEGKEEE